MGGIKKTNRGKDFEARIRKCFESLSGVSFDRLPDPMGGYSGVQNICDFSMFHAPDMFYLECKCLYGNTLNYKGAITANQWNGMIEKSKIKRCVAGVCVWFIDYDITVFVNIKDLVAHRESGHASLNISDIIGENAIPHFIIDGVKKRVMFDYIGESALKKLHKLSNDTWGEYTNG